MGAAARRRAAEWDAHGAYVLRTLRCLGVPERELEDARQDVLEVATRRAGEIDGSGLRAWMYGVCLRKALVRRRDAARRREELGREDERGVEADQEASVARGQALARALVILESLGDEKRAVFVLYEVEQLTMAEVAEVLGCPLQTAYARLYAARREVEATLKRARARRNDE